MKNIMGLASDLRHRETSKAEAALEKIYKIFQEELCLIAIKIVKDTAEAEDLVSETLLKLWQKRAGIKNDDHLVGFLKLTLTRACFTALKTQQRKNQIPHNLQNDSEQPPVMISLQNLDAFKRALEIIDTMPPQTREVYRLCLQEMSYEEIAEELGISLETARTQASRARKILDNKLRKSPDRDEFLMLLFLYYVGSTYSA